VEPGEVTIRAWRPGDERAINEAFNRVFGTSRSLEEWRWKFRPGEHPVSIMLAWRGEDLLAQYAGLPTRFRILGEEVIAAQIVDVFSTPEARRLFGRRSVYLRTAEKYFEVFGERGRLAFIYGFPGIRHLRLGLLQLGYGAMEPEPVMVWRRPVLHNGPHFRRLPYRAEPMGVEGQVADRLWERLAWRYPCGVVRDGAWVRRRFTGHPTVDYRRFLLLPRFGTEPVGWVVFRTDGGVCRWVDLLWDSAHPGALVLAAHLAARLTVQEGCPSGEELWLVGDREAEPVLAELGYTVAPEPRGLVFTTPPAFDPSVDVTRLEGRVYLPMADSDLV